MSRRTARRCERSCSTRTCSKTTTQTDTIADLHDVPVLFPINNKGQMLYPIAVSDDVYVHIASCSLAQIK